MLSLPCFVLGKKNAKKRLSQDQAKDDAGQQPEATGTNGPPGLEGLSLAPKGPLIQPKTEPEEHESKWTNLYNTLFTYLTFYDASLVICWLDSVSVVFAVQVKVEEVEMETPIEAPDNPQQVPLGIIKKEAGGEQSKSAPHRSPEQSSLEDMHDKMEQSETAAGRREDCGSLEESFTGESNMEQSENKNQERGSQGEDSESNTGQRDLWWLWWSKISGKKDYCGFKKKKTEDKIRQTTAGWDI